jgi:hypothetical protein
VLGHFQAAFPRQWFVGNEQIGAALLLIGVVFPRDLSRLGWLRGILVLDEILAHLIHANARERGIIGLAVDIEHIFHTVDKVRVGFLGKTPGFFEPRL